MVRLLEAHDDFSGNLVGNADFSCPSRAIQTFGSITVPSLFRNKNFYVIFIIQFERTPVCLGRRKIDKGVYHLTCHCTGQMIYRNDNEDAVKENAILSVEKENPNQDRVRFSNMVIFYVFIPNHNLLLLFVGEEVVVHYRLRVLRCKLRLVPCE